MSLLLNALKKAEEGEQSPAEQQSAAGQPEAEGQTPAPQTAEGSGETLDFDRIVEETEEEEEEAASTAATESEEERRKRVDAARVFSAGEEEAATSNFKKLLYSVLGIVVVGGGGYFVLVSGVIPGVDLRAISSLFGMQQQAPQVVQTTENVGAQLQVSDDIVLLPVPRVDIQSEVDFAALRLPENTRSAIGDEEYIKRISYLTGFDINKERARSIEEQRALLLDLEIESERSANLEVEIEEVVDESAAEEEQESTIEIITQTADASREAKLLIDSLTPSDGALDIVINEAAQSGVSDSVMQVAQAAQVEVKLSQEGEERQQMIKQARALYYKGAYLEAETIYRNVLVSSPTSRDALRGIAQIAVATGRYQTAVATYLDLLSYYPNDAVAIAELTNLRGDSGNFYEIEKALKSALGKTPNADGRLYFSLGNLYAQNGKLLQAQQSYFEAFSREANNPDYAYNLAVALDYLNKPQLAVRYYGEALRLAKDTPVGFNRAEVTARIKDLN